MVGILLALPRDLATQLDHEARRHGHTVLAHCNGSRELREAFAVHSAAAAALVVAEALDAELLAAADAAGIRLVAIAATRAERRRAGDLGLREVAERDAPWEELEALLLGAATSATSVRDRRGVVLAVWGPPGSPGRTTVAITLAAEFATMGHTVLLVDADTHGASIAPALGLPDESPGFAAACRLAGADGLTHAEVDRVSHAVSSSWRVLTGLGRPTRWRELTAERIEATISVCRTVADVVVMDLASSLEKEDRNAATLTTLANADRVIAVGSADPIGLSRFLRSHPDLVQATTAEITVVMNRVRPSAIGLNARDQITQALVRFAGIRSSVLIADDRPAFDAALLVGAAITQTMPRSPARLALRDLAAQLMPVRQR